MKRDCASTLATIALLAAGLAVDAGAQGFGLQTIESYESRDNGNLDITVGVMFGPDQAFFGIRDTFPMRTDMRLFVDLGFVDPPDDQGYDLAAQAGLIYCLPFEIPNDISLGLRLAFYGMNSDRLNVFGGNLMLMGSGQIYVRNFFLYGGLGCDYSTARNESDTSVESEVDRELNPILALGVLMPVEEINKDLFLYLELTVTDNAFIGFGVRYR